MTSDTEKINSRALGSKVMEYLGEFNSMLKNTTPDNAKRRRVKESALFRFVQKGRSEADNIPVQSQVTGKPEDLKVSNLLSDMRKTGSTDKPDKSVFNMRLSDVQDRVRKITKSPLILSLLVGGTSALAGWGLSKWLNPISTADRHKKISLKHQSLLGKYNVDPSKLPYEQRKKLARQAIDEVDSAERNKHIWTALGVGSVAALANSALHYDDRGPVSLVKYLKKDASMLGPSPVLPTEMVRDAVLHNDGLDPWTKLQTINMLEHAPEPAVTSTDIIDTAVATGASALANKPLGRIAVSAAADYALGYGLGSVLGISRPDRLGAIFGIGTAVSNLTN